MSSSIRDIDYGYQKLLETIGTIKGSVAVGVDDRPHEPSGDPCDEIGQAHEFGTDTIPERSFLRRWVDAEKVTIKDWIRAAAEATLQSGGDWEKAMAIIGAAGVASVQARMIAGIDPALAPETLKRRAFGSTPLVDTRQLLEAVVYEVDVNKKPENSV